MLKAQIAQAVFGTDLNRSATAAARPSGQQMLEEYVRSIRICSYLLLPLITCWSVKIAQLGESFPDNHRHLLARSASAVCR